MTSYLVFYSEKGILFFVVRFKMVPLKNLLDGFTLLIKYTVPEENGIPDQKSHHLL